MRLRQEQSNAADPQIVESLEKLFQLEFKAEHPESAPKTQTKQTSGKTSILVTALSFLLVGLPVLFSFSQPGSPASLDRLEQLK